MDFDRYVGIDYSGAEYPETPLPALQVYAAQGDNPAERVPPPSAYGGKAKNWSRRAIALWLVGLARSGSRFIAGIDHCFSLPLDWFHSLRLATWDEFLLDFVRRWPTHSPGVSVQSLLPDIGKQIDPSSDFRLSDRWTQAAKSVFSFQGPGAVGKSTFAGIPWLHFLREQAGDRLHFWPFDGFDIPWGRSVVLEVYPALCTRRYPREGGNQHQHDAYSVASWLRDMDAREALGRYFRPPLTPEEELRAGLEGWIFGVG
jgi:hypothetical protein